MVRGKPTIVFLEGTGDFRFLTVDKNELKKGVEQKGPGCTYTLAGIAAVLVYGSDAARRRFVVNSFL